LPSPGGQSAADAQPEIFRKEEETTSDQTAAV